MKKALALSATIYCISTFAQTDTHSLIFKVEANRPDLTITPNINFAYPKVGIKITSPGFELENIGQDCTPSSNGFCLFSTSPQSPKTLSVSGQGAFSYQLCANGEAHLNCQNYAAEFPAKAYITSTFGGSSGGTGFISICQLDINGNFTSEDCTSVDNPSWNEPLGNHVSGNNIYVASGLGGSNSNQGFVSVCELDSNGYFSPNNCTDIDKPEWRVPAGVTVMNDTLYVVNESGGNTSDGFVSVCQLDANGKFTPQDCEDVNKVEWIGPIGATVKNNQIYIASSNGGTVGLPGFVSVCSLDKNGRFSSNDCVDLDKPEWSNPTGVAINNNKLYIANQFGGTSGSIGFISVCTLNANGLFTPSDCVDIDKPEWNTPSGVNVFNNKLYVANQLGGTSGGSGFISVCTLNDDGLFKPADCNDVDQAEWSNTNAISVN